MNIALLSSTTIFLGKPLLLIILSVTVTPVPKRAFIFEYVGFDLKDGIYRLGDFLKELDLTEGRSTGIPTIQEELEKNGSPRAIFETNDERSYINVFIPIHEGCGDTVIQNETVNETQNKILREIQRNNSVTYTELARALKMGRATIGRNLSTLKEKGILVRVGGDKMDIGKSCRIIKNKEN